MRAATTAVQRTGRAKCISTFFFIVWWRFLDRVHVVSLQKAVCKDTIKGSFSLTYVSAEPIPHFDQRGIFT